MMIRLFDIVACSLEIFSLEGAGLDYSIQNMNRLNENSSHSSQVDHSRYGLGSRKIHRILPSQYVARLARILNTFEY